VIAKITLIARKRPRTNRIDISTKDPEIRALWAAGLTLAEIKRRVGLTPGGAAFGVIDPTPQPLGCPPFSARPGETAEQRCWRRFPINEHKPGGAR